MKNPRAMHFYPTFGHSHYLYSAHKRWVDKTYGKTNLIEPKKIWVPKDEIIFVADTLNSKDEVSITVSGYWIHSTLKEKKVYVPKFGTLAKWLCRSE